jgi:hypothetical protein
MYDTGLTTLVEKTTGYGVLMHPIKCAGCGKMFDADNGKERLKHHNDCRNSLIGLANNLLDGVEILRSGVYADKAVSEGIKSPADVIPLKRK